MLFLSIHPKYVQAILEGRKTIELRKRQPNISLGEGVVIYSTMPECKIVATATLADFESGAPKSLWPKIKSSAAVSRDAFDSYYANAENAVAIHLCDVLELVRPIELAELRERWQGFHPPQQFRYLTKNQQRFIERRASKAISEYAL